MSGLVILHIALHCIKWPAHMDMTGHLIDSDLAMTTHLTAECWPLLVIRGTGDGQ